KDITAPTLINNSISSNLNNVDLSNKIVLDFSEKMDDNSINSSSIILRNDLTQDLHTLKINHTNKQVIISPKLLLESNTSYSLVLNSKLKDQSNNSFEEKTISFKTNSKIVFNSYEYNIIKSKITGKEWLDRNIGAQKVCENKADENCYGDYFQWGRKANGHEKKDSEVIDTSLNPLEKDVLKNGKFATWSDDWRINPNSDLWNGVNAANNICPIGFKVPSIDELLMETKNVNELQFPDEKISGQYENIDNFLKLPNNGFRKNRTRDGIIEIRAYSGSIWSSSTNDVGMSYYLDYYPGGINSSLSWRSMGKAVRCIKDYEDTVINEVVSTTPSNNQKNVDVNTEFRVQFLKAVVSGISRENILLYIEGKQLSLNIMRNISNHTFIIAPNHYQVKNYNLEYNSKYKFIIKKDIKDASGKTMLEDEVITFTTQKSPEYRAVEISSYPRNKTINFARNENIRLDFSKELDQNTIDSNIFLKLNDTVIPAIFIYANKTLTINPTNTLESNVTYEIEVLENLKDTKTVLLGNKLTFAFTTSTEVLTEDKNGNVYKDVTSTRTKKTWLDRNLGALKVCTSLSDSKCFGEYFSFSKTKEADICPNGYKVPSISELRNEMEGYTMTNLFDNFLKLPVNGKKHSNGALDSSSSLYIWSNQEENINNSYALKVLTYTASYDSEDKNNALAIRCIKEGN
ncbi:MAG: Ig-like domain-containing protein, partial [Campylobacteraceae bacterium]|nr:Ig-like domain-containing protein [Campylobacteraceae bacterium]